MLDLIVNSAVTHTLMLVLPLVLALLLRWLRCPGWAMVGGAVAGILLGPSVLGRVAPDQYERHFVGVVETAMDEAAGSDDRWRFQRPFRSYTAAVAAITLLGAGLLRRGARQERRWPASSLSIGLGSALVPGGLALSAVTGLADETWSVAALAGAAVAIGPWRAAGDGPGDERSLVIMSAAGRIASLVAISAAMWSMWAQRGTEGLLWSAPLLALIIGRLLPPLRHATGPPTAEPLWLITAMDPRRLVTALLAGAFVPSLTACAAMRIELDALSGSWPLLIVLVILAGAGRWLGAWIGALASRAHTEGRSIGLRAAVTACGPTQIAVVALAVHAWALPADTAPALLAGAVLLDIARPRSR